MQKTLIVLAITTISLCLGTASADSINYCTGCHQIDISQEIGDPNSWAMYEPRLLAKEMDNEPGDPHEWDVYEPKLRGMGVDKKM